MRFSHSRRIHDNMFTLRNIELSFLGVFIQYFSKVYKRIFSRITGSVY